MGHKNIIPIAGTKKGIGVFEYQGNIQLVQVEQGANDVWYKQWVFRSKWVKGKDPVPDEHKSPMGIWLGKNKAQAVDYLREIAKIIDGF